MRCSSILRVVRENWFRAQTSRHMSGTTHSTRSPTQLRSISTACGKRSTANTSTNCFTLVVAKDTSLSPANNLRWSINLLLRFDSVYSAAPTRKRVCQTEQDRRKSPLRYSCYWSVSLQRRLHRIQRRHRRHKRLRSRSTKRYDSQTHRHQLFKQLF